ncbi:hypothetical protein FNO01nite_13520 [Flavobacterium noncentrifugens]|uniref:Uncharacterized protein n=1 Tax=Flavobacterium noncentrifugens TaxID=1128970 RepID=A0A1G8VX05_9FLAO|nr:hypothetical protein [Flavobacterium noncentrifugens]GEP50680.1 hypothetical protein FNO01nite_13520 [Flavobacterium noncentrifugens]SDJ70466.1 hypothetical protein SAMN04487935_1549 [Flavobacterium noncentrifugens]
MKIRKNYNDEVIKLSKAIDIAVRAFDKSDLKDKDWIIQCYKEWQRRLFDRDDFFKKMASLKYDIEHVFTYFQEGAGKEVEYFWKELERQKLDYQREDKLRKILDRGKIRGRIEFEYVTDVIVPAEQEKRITEEEAKQLGKMLYDFEFKKRKKQ